MIAKQEREFQDKCQEFVNENVYDDVTEFVARLQETDPDDWESLRVAYVYAGDCEEAGWKAKQVGDSFVIVNESTEQAYNHTEQEMEWFSDSPGYLLDYFDDWLNSLDDEFLFASKLEITGSDWKNLCEADSIEPEEREVDAYFEVSYMLANYLKEEGELIHQVDHKQIWGRVGSGRNVIGDDVIKKIVQRYHKEQSIV